MLRLVPVAFGLVALLSSSAFAKTLTVDTAKSVINWKGEKKLVDAPHNGTLKLKSGKVETDDKGVVKGGEFVIDMNSIEDLDLKGKDDFKAKLEGHLKSDDFFNVAKYPTAKFVMKTVTASGGDKYKVGGDLTIRDKTNPVSFDATIKNANGVYTAKTENFTIDRSKFDVKYNSEKFFNPAALGDKVIKDELTVALDLVAK